MQDPCQTLGIVLDARSFIQFLEISIFKVRSRRSREGPCLSDDRPSNGLSSLNYVLKCTGHGIEDSKMKQYYMQCFEPQALCRFIRTANLQILVYCQDLTTLLCAEKLSQDHDLQFCRFSGTTDAPWSIGNASLEVYVYQYCSTINGKGGIKAFY